jgi:hypothetical protein
VKIAILFGAVLWGFITYFILAYGWWALLVVPAFFVIAVLILLMSTSGDPEPFRTHRGKTW